MNGFFILYACICYLMTAYELIKVGIHFFGCSSLLFLLDGAKSEVHSTRPEEPLPPLQSSDLSLNEPMVKS
jgi:hypothetical protein